MIIKDEQSLKMKKVLKELEKERLLRTSISKLTHELKNPIAVCKGYLEMLDLNDISKTERYLSIITGEIERSKNIIEEFSDYGKLKKLDIEEIELSVLIEDIANVLTPLFKKNNAKLKVNAPEEIYIKADYNKLKQVLINLLKNTIEAKKDDKELNVDMKLEETVNSVIISVIDDGIGMSEENLKKVCDVFFTTKEKGTGLGLTFSKEVIELHNGIMNIYSEEQIGTRIVIKLPKEKKSEDFSKKSY